MSTPVCLICERPVPGYVPEYCCDGHECGCMGRPINPCVCGTACYEALMAGIGMSFEVRRVAAGITKFNPRWREVQ